MKTNKTNCNLILIDRRKFLCLGVSLASPLALFSQTPTPPIPALTPADIPDVPDRPAVERWSEDAFETRGARFLDLQWKPVDEASGYELRFRWATGERFANVRSTQHREQNLTPQTDYEIALRAISSGGVSEWSQPLRVCTRPEKPNAPSQGYSEMIQVDSGMTVTWNLTTQGLQAAGASVRLYKRRLQGEYAVAAKVSGLIGRFDDPDFQAFDKYRIAWEIPSPLAPDNVNLSESSDEIQPSKMVFGALRLPGESEIRQISIGSLRDYYG